MPASRPFFLCVTGVAAFLAACEPNVVIGSKFNLEAEVPGGQAGSAVVVAGTSGGGMGGAGGTEALPGGAAGATEPSEAGAPSAGAGGAPTLSEWCATAPWKSNTPVEFVSDDGNVVPPGDYLVTYVSGAQIHDVDLGYEVTRQYFGKDALKAGHHVFNGTSPETAATTLWLDETGIVQGLGSIAAVEEANRGHTWPLQHTGGELYVTLYDDEFGDNSGPGSRFCIVPSVP